MTSSTALSIASRAGSPRRAKLASASSETLSTNTQFGMSKTALTSLRNRSASSVLAILSSSSMQTSERASSVEISVTNSTNVPTTPGSESGSLVLLTSFDAPTSAPKGFSSTDSDALVADENDNW